MAMSAASLEHFTEPLPASQARLLIVDDEPSIIFAMREFFADSDFTVDCSTTFDGCVELLETRTYDAVITDLHLTPDRRSDGLLVLILARQRQPHARTFLLTAFSSAEVESEARFQGASACLAKPIQMERLVNTVQQSLQDRDAMD